MEGEKWYSPNAIAEMMDIDYETARKLVYRLPHVDVGGGSKRSCPRVRPEIFNAWLMQQDATIHASATYGRYAEAKNATDARAAAARRGAGHDDGRVRGLF